MSTSSTAVYLRQSLDRDGNQLAVARQRKECLALCERRGWTEVVEYVDNDRSATNGKPRPEYRRMLSDIGDGRIGAVVVWDLDRLHRQPRELEDFIDLADEHRLKLATVTGEVDLSTDNGRLFARIKGAVGKSETERKAARQRAAARQKAEHGRPAWKRAFGYLDGANGPEPDPATAPLVKQMYAAVLAGSSLKDIARTLNTAGAYGLKGTPWSQASVSLFLRKARNAGLREYTDSTTKQTAIVGKGTWTALVDESTWRAAQSVLNAPGRAPGRKTVRKHLLTGALHCGRPGCNGYLAAQWSNEQARRVRYGCRVCQGVVIRADDVEPLLYRVVGGRLAQPDAVDLLRAEIHDEAEAEALRIEANTLLARLDEIADERADGLLTGAQARRATERVQEKLAKIEARQQDSERLRVFDGLPLGRPEVVAAVKELSADRFRAVLSVLCTVTILPVGRGRTTDPDRVRIDWR